MKRYVLGFAFQPTFNDEVVLIRKLKPEWQAGKLNGVGGSIEEGESPSQAMSREFFEEAGVATDPQRWRSFATMRGAGWEVFCFETRLHNYEYDHLESKTAEQLVMCKVDELPYEGDVIENIPVLVAAALINPEEPSNRRPHMILNYD
jgi:8-oxo-dGTP diphosphatase